jgi:adenine deaminase
VDGTGTHVLPLEIAGLMSADGAAVAEGYAKLDRLAREMGATLTAPYMTLAFMALLVIPALKLSDRGLFDARSFRFTSLYVD